MFISQWKAVFSRLEPTLCRPANQSSLTVLPTRSLRARRLGETSRPIHSAKLIISRQASFWKKWLWHNSRWSDIYRGGGRGRPKVSDGWRHNWRAQRSAYPRFGTCFHSACHAIGTMYFNAFWTALIIFEFRTFYINREQMMCSFE